MTDGNLTLVLKQIKIKDFDKWSSMKTDEDVQDVVKDLTGDIKAQKAAVNRTTARLIENENLKFLDEDMED